MTRTEAKDILINRLDFKIEGANPDSKRFYESEHPIVTLDNIKECQPEADIYEEDFAVYLTQLKTETIYQLLADVFVVDDISDDILDFYPALFDNCLSLLMTIKVIELIITTQRSNRTQRISKEAAQQIHFDLNGNYGKDMNPNYPRAYGIAHRYQKELSKLKNTTGNQKMLVSITTK